ncbi:molecular chaperone HtpG [Caloramator sp. E03]|uniref:molecular chaperone HtpG n=1 Tax=Caloramator sp. E03 TaxID=2576307 RepID=UPI001FAA2019|nr:molecular chaperone HtpG [Caloramator sp. E03]
MVKAAASNSITNQNGFLSIESKNIFTILKQWLYTEQDIVFRELISNALDAIEKLSQLRKNDISIPQIDGKIVVRLDTESKCLVISDNGIGMSSEEVDKYINQIAFSGATDFINKHNQAGKDTIIGHFGVGFYSAFMISDHVAIDTKSYKKDTPAVRWDCMSDMSYNMCESNKSETGTDVILYLDEKSPYLEKPDIIYQCIKKYFIFSKTAIYFEAPGFDHVLVNNPSPIWRQPKDSINSDDMNTFYKEFFNDTCDPLYWIQFESIDIGLRGILFFRNTKNGTDEIDGKIKVYNRGVYVGDNIRELIPKFVNLQNGIIECDYLPLVVSRSTIREDKQYDNMISLIYESLSQEVTIALNDMFQNKREVYEEYWPHLNAFVKYAVLQDKIFASVMTRKVIFKDIYGKYYTIQEYLENESNSHPDTIYYASDEIEQAHYIEIFKKCGLNALLFDHVIDQPFMRKYEVIHPKLKFIRIDSNIESLFDGHLDEDDNQKVEILTQKITKALGNRLSSINLKITKLEYNNISTLIINDEMSRRMVDMLEIYGYINPTDFYAKGKKAQSTLLVNINNEIVKFILKNSDEDTINIVINQLFDLSLMSQQSLRPEDVEQFINRSEAILASLIKKM